ncbi:gag-pol polyprotein [Tanacetum coccineum]
MKAILTKDKCLAAIGERPTEVTDDSKWDEMDENAIENLHLALADGARSLHNKKFLKRLLYALRMTESTLVTERVNSINTLFSQLTYLDCKIELQERAKILLQSLPDSYDQVIINLTSNVLADYLVFDDVATTILEEENRCNNREDRKTSSRQSGHFGKDCRGLNTSYPHGNVASTSEDGNALCCEAVVANEIMKRFADIWLFDIGATFHMTIRGELFHQYKPFSEGGSMYSCNDHELKIIRIGSIMVKMHDVTVRGNTKQDYESHKRRTCTYERRKSGCKLIPAEGEIIEEAETSIASHSPSHRVAITWYQKLGHMSEQGMKILMERKLLPGLAKVSLPFCEHCVISKQHLLKFKMWKTRWGVNSFTN